MQAYTAVTPAKPTRNRPQTDKKSSNSVRDRFAVGIDSVLSVYVRADKFVGERSFKPVERSVPDKLSVVCRLYVGVVSVLSGSVRGHVGLNSTTDGRWFVGLRSVRYRAYVGRPDTDSRPIQDQTSRGLMEGINMEKSSQGCYNAIQIGFCDSYHNNITDIQNRLPYSKVVYPAIIVFFFYG